METLTNIMNRHPITQTDYGINAEFQLRTEMAVDWGMAIVLKLK